MNHQPNVNRSAGRSTALRRIVATATALAALSGAFVLGTQVSDGEAPSQRARPLAGGSAEPVWGTPVAFHGQLRAASSCDDLSQHYLDEARDRVSEYGWDQPDVVYASGTAPGATEDGAATSKAPEVGSSDTGTTVQESGVDEPDLAKTDGRVLVHIDDELLRLYDVSTDAPREQASLVVPGISEAEVLLSGDTVVAVGTGDRSHRWGVERTTRVVTLDISDPSEPRVTHESTYDARLLSARQHGSTVRLVFSAGLPDLDFRRPSSSTGVRTVREHNQRLVESSSLTDWLPGVSDDGAPETSLLDCTDVAVPRDQLGLDTVAVVGFDVTSPTTRSTVGIASQADTVYEAEDRLFLASNTSDGGWGTGEATVFDFTLDDTTARYHGSVRMAGEIKDRWSLDWAQGTLRVAQGRSASTDNSNSVVVYEEGTDDLREVARVENLGIDEDIKAVRWFDDLAVLVTFRETDPLYTIDLSDPRDPELLGALKIPGFSEYLHPVGQDQLIGMGQSVDELSGARGAQAGLFDVSDLADPHRTDLVEYGPDTRALAGLDPRAFTWLPEIDTAVTVLQDNWGTSSGELAVLRPSGSTLEREEFDLPSGTEVSRVRVLPLREGAVLVADDVVETLDLR